MLGIKCGKTYSTLSYNFSVNRIEHLADAIDQIHVQKHSLITHAVSSCICLLLSALEDDKVEVQLKAKHIIENISVKSLKVNYFAFVSFFSLLFAHLSRILLVRMSQAAWNLNSQQYHSEDLQFCYRCRCLVDCGQTLSCFLYFSLLAWDTLLKEIDTRESKVLTIILVVSWKHLRP